MFSHSMSVLRLPDFRRMWIALAISRFGSATTLVAMPLLILSTTRSAADTGLVAFVEGVAGIGVLLPAGALADRCDRTRMMMWCEVLNGVSVGVVAFAVINGHPSLLVVATMAGLSGGSAGGFQAASSAVIPQLVAEDQLPAAISLVHTRNSAVLLAGPVVGGLLYSVDPAVPFLLDTVSFAGSAWLIGSMHVDLRVARPPESFGADMVAGIMFIARQPILRLTGFVATAVNAVFGGLILAVVVLVRHQGADNNAVGVVFAAIGLGSLAGALIAPNVAARCNLRQILIALLSVLALLVPVMSLVPQLAVVVIVVACLTALAPALNIRLISAQLAFTPDPLQGRVQAGMMMCAIAMAPLGPLLGGVGLRYLGSGATFDAIAGFFAVLALACAVSPTLKAADPESDTPIDERPVAALVDSAPVTA